MTEGHDSRLAVAGGIVFYASESIRPVGLEEMKDSHPGFGIRWLAALFMTPLADYER